MATWVLIMSLVAGYGTAVNSVPGFADQAVCQTAGEMWKESANLGGGTKARFVCVQTSK